MAIIDFLTETTYMNTYHQNGSFLPNNNEFEIDKKVLPFISRPWNDVFENNPMTYTTRLIEMIRKRK